MITWIFHIWIRKIYFFNLILKIKTAYSLKDFDVIFPIQSSDFIKKSLGLFLTKDMQTKKCKKYIFEFWKKKNYKICLWQKKIEKFSNWNEWYKNLTIGSFWEGGGGSAYRYLGQGRNFLPDHVKTSDTLSKFKHKLKEYLLLLFILI